MKLEELLNSELYAQVKAAIDAANEGKEDKLTHIRYADLSEGGYVSKAKHDSLQALFDNKSSELDTANNLIAELKKGTKGNEELQGKITGYETQVSELQKELVETKIKSALKVGLLSEKCDDVDYISFVIEKQLKEQGKSLELDENENIKGFTDLIEGVKAQLPNHFEKEGKLRVEPNPLPKPEDSPKGLTKEEFNKMGYNSRVKLKAEQPEVYESMMKG